MVSCRGRGVLRVLRLKVAIPSCSGGQNRGSPEKTGVTMEIAATILLVGFVVAIVVLTGFL